MSVSDLVLQGKQEQLEAMPAQLDAANGALIDTAVGRDEARHEAAFAAALQPDTERHLQRAEASLAAANKSVSTLQRQLGDQATECSRLQACSEQSAWQMLPANYAR